MQFSKSDGPWFCQNRKGGKEVRVYDFEARFIDFGCVLEEISENSEERGMR